MVHKSYGVLYACADDLGGVLLSITSLLILQDIFAHMATVSGLILQPSKCVTIPLASPNSFKFAHYGRWLATHLPAWAHFQVASSAEYLGFMVGPTAGSCQYDKVVAAVDAKIQSIIASATPPSLSVFHYNICLVPKFSYKAQLSPPPVNLDVLESKWACNILKAPYNSFSPCLLHYGKSFGFYELTSIKVMATAAAVRAAWVTVSDWSRWFSFINTTCADSVFLPLAALLHERHFSPDFWDHPPFACYMASASSGRAFPNIASTLKFVFQRFSDPMCEAVHRHSLQKAITCAIKPILIPNTVLVNLSFKASKQKVVASPKQLKDFLHKLASFPLVISVSYIRVLTNALCTTTRIKNSPTLPCFACGKGRDDLYHFLRCPYFSFIFQLTPAFGNIHMPYFSLPQLARISAAFEVYYFLTRQYGHNVFKFSFPYLANKASYMAKQVAIKDKIQHLAQFKVIPQEKALEFVQGKQLLCNAEVSDIVRL